MVVSLLEMVMFYMDIGVDIRTVHILKDGWQVHQFYLIRTGISIPLFAHHRVQALFGDMVLIFQPMEVQALH